MMHRSGLATGLTRLLLLTLVLSLATGCARFGWFKTREDPIETLPVEQLYDMAKEALRANNFTRAERIYQRLVARFPFGTYTEQSQLELAYAQFKANKKEDATSTINRFIRTYPAHPDVAYAYYLRALINFETDTNVLTRMARIDTTTRDMSAAQQSFADFGELIRRHPGTRYAADARDRMVHLRNRMAQHEINVATFYLQRGAWIAAQRRGQYVLENFPQSIHTGDALAVIAESYVRLGQDGLAADARRVLEANAPDHPYLGGGWPAKESFWRKLVPLGGLRN